MKYLLNNKKMASGYTLIELIVVIAIIGILSTVVITALNSSRIRSRDATRLLQIRQFKNALELFYSDNGYYPNCFDVGYIGGCDYVDFHGPGSLADTSKDGQFMRFLQPYLKGPIVDPINNASNFYLYSTNAEYPLGSGKMYTYVIGAILEDATNPVLRTSIGYGDPTGPAGAYVLGP